MKLSRYGKSTDCRVFVLSLFSLLVLSGCSVPGKDKAAALSSEPSPFSRDIIDTWVLVGTPDDIREPPDAGGQFKFITDRHWAVTQASPDTGEVVYHHGGTYTLKGDEYIENVEYANENTAHLINTSNKFKITVEGDTLTQIGIGNPWTQVWKRAK